MSPVRITGMASGLPPNIVEQLMEAERIPVKQMEMKKAVDEDKLKLVGEFEAKLNDINKNLAELTTTRGFFNNKLVSGNPNIIDGVADPEKVMTGDWMVEVLQLAQKPGAITNGFTDRDRTQLGVGYLRFDTPEGRKDVYISNSNNTLDGVANAVNNSGTGVRAQVIMDKRNKEAPYRLLVTGLKTGDDMQVTFPTVYLLDSDQDVFFEETRAAQNAKIKVDGFDMELSENEIRDVIPGVTLDLKQASPGTPVRLTVKEDLEAIAGKIKSFVDAYNGALGFIQAQHKLSKDKSGKERLGPLGGDGLLRSVESTLRRVIMNPQMTESSIRRVMELGIEFNRNGTLNFSQEKFQKVLDTQPFEVAGFFRGDRINTGFVTTVKRDIGNIVTGAFSPIVVRKNGINDRIKQLDQRLEAKEKQLEKKEDQLRRKFSDLESKMSKINAQGAAVQGLSSVFQRPNQ